MNRGLMHKTLREVWAGTLIFGLALFGVMTALAYVLPGYFTKMESQLSKLPFLRNMLSALLATELGEKLHVIAFVSIAWVHPIVLALLWGHIVLYCTRIPAGEIDRGTADILMGLPVSRWRIYVSETVICLLTGVLLIALAGAGFALGIGAAEENQRPDLGLGIAVALNLFAVYVAVAGFAFLISTLSDFRKRAIGIVFGVVITSFFLNVLAQFWEPAKEISFLGLLHYYKPYEILQEGLWPTGNIILLSTVGIACWLAGGMVFQKRDICTI